MPLQSFKIRSQGKILDYRLGEDLDLSKVRLFFQRDYQVQKIWDGPRHIFGVLKKQDKIFFLKLATSEGISVVTKKEYQWNNYFNINFSKASSFRVPVNFDKGIYDKKYFYLITDYLKGELLCPLNDSFKQSSHSKSYIESVIELSELIQKMPGIKSDYLSKFVGKAETWFKDIPKEVRGEFSLETLLQIVQSGASRLLTKPRHGDFTPWHMIRLDNLKLGLLDGEHWQQDGVENYDICYFIQRLFSVLKNPRLAQDIYSRLLKKNYRKDKLKVVLAARAIGGFLDESLIDSPNYTFAGNFKNWVIKI